MESHIRGVKVGICCEVVIDNCNLTNGSGRKGGKSTEGISERLTGGFDAKSADDSGGEENDSVDELGNCGGVIVYCRVDATGGHQQ